MAKKSVAVRGDYPTVFTLHHLLYSLDSLLMLRLEKAAAEAL